MQAMDHFKLIALVLVFMSPTTPNFDTNKLLISFTYLLNNSPSSSPQIFLEMTKKDGKNSSPRTS